MGAYEILEMKSVPAYAAVHEAVEGVKAGRGRPAAGLVNAVLRKLAAASPGTLSFPCPEEDLEGFLATWGSHPRWLVRRWMRNFGPQAARELVEAGNEEPATYLRAVEGTAAELLRRLAHAGVAAVAGSGASVRLGPGEDPAAALAVAPCVVQDPAASLVVEYAAPKPDSTIADLCAAPGGKALALSGMAGAVVAADVSPRRLARVAESAERLRRGGAGAKVWPVAADARSPAVRGAAMVVLDVPCSATGVVRRRPDVRWRLAQQGLRTLARTQRAMLEGAVAAVPSGGVLVLRYVCTGAGGERGPSEGFLDSASGVPPGAGTGAAPLPGRRRMPCGEAGPGLRRSRRRVRRADAQGRGLMGLGSSIRRRRKDDSSPAGTGCATARAHAQTGPGGCVAIGGSAGRPRALGGVRGRVRRVLRVHRLLFSGAGAAGLVAGGARLAGRGDGACVAIAGRFGTRLGRNRFGPPSVRRRGAR